MNSSMSPTWRIFYGTLIMCAMPVSARFSESSTNTAKIVAGQALSAPTPIVTEPRDFRREEGSADGVTTYTVIYVPTLCVDIYLGRSRFQSPARIKTFACGNKSSSGSLHVRLMTRLRDSLEQNVYKWTKLWTPIFAKMIA